MGQYSMQILGHFQMQFNSRPLRSVIFPIAGRLFVISDCANRFDDAALQLLHHEG